MYQAMLRLSDAIRDALHAHNYRDKDIDKVRVVIFTPTSQMAFTLEAHALHTIPVAEVRPDDVPGRSQDFFTVRGVRMLFSPYNPQRTGDA